MSNHYAGMGLHQEQRQSMAQLTLQRLDRELFDDETRRKAVAHFVFDTMHEHVNEYSGILKMAGNIDLVRDEFVRLAAEDCLLNRAEEFDKMPRNPHIKRIEQTVNDVVEIYARTRLQNLLSGGASMRSIFSDPAKHESLDQRYALLLDEGERRRHYAYLIQTGQVKFRDVRTDTDKNMEDDIELFASLYKKNQLTGEEIVNLASGKKSLLTLLANPEDHELKAMRRLLPVTRDLRKKETLAEQREKQTMFARFAYGTLGQENIMAVSIHTLSPMDPEKDKDFSEENEAFISGGVSKGRMTVPDEHTLNALKHRLDPGGTSQDLFFIMGAEPGIAKYSLADGINDIAPYLMRGSSFFTYTLGGMHVSVRGKDVGLPVTQVQNVRCLNLLIDAKYKMMNATDYYDNPSAFVSFVAKINEERVPIQARPVWMHLWTNTIDLADLSIQTGERKEGILAWAQNFRIEKTKA